MLEIFILVEQVKLLYQFFLAKELNQKLEKNPVIIKKFYKNHEDEHKLIKNILKI